MIHTQSPLPGAAKGEQLAGASVEGSALEGNRVFATMRLGLGVSVFLGWESWDVN